MNILASTIGERIERIIEEKDLKKVQFARIINIDQSYVTQLIKGKSNPSDRLIEDICEKLNVNESWLRTGEGEIFEELDRDEAIVTWAAKLARDDCNNGFAKRLATLLASLNEKEWEILEEKARYLFAEEKKKD